MAYRSRPAGVAKKSASSGGNERALLLSSLVYDWCIDCSLWSKRPYCLAERSLSTERPDVTTGSLLGIVVAEGA